MAHLNCEQPKVQDADWRQLPEDIVRHEIIPYLGRKRFNIKAKIYRYFNHPVCDDEGEIHIKIIHIDLTLELSFWRLKSINDKYKMNSCMWDMDNVFVHFERHLCEPCLIPGGRMCKIVCEFLYDIQGNYEFTLTRQKVDNFCATKFLKKVLRIYNEIKAYQIEYPNSGELEWLFAVQQN